MEQALGLFALIAFVFWLLVVFPAWIHYEAHYNTVNRHRAPGFWNWLLSGATEPDD